MQVRVSRENGRGEVPRRVTVWGVGTTRALESVSLLLNVSRRQQAIVDHQNGAD